MCVWKSVCICEYGKFIFCKCILYFILLLMFFDFFFKRERPPLRRKIKMTSSNENGQKILEMLQLYESLTPNLRPNLIPPNLHFVNECNRQTINGDSDDVDADADDMEEDGKEPQVGGLSSSSSPHSIKIDNKEREFLSIFSTTEQTNRLKRLMSKSKKKYATKSKIKKPSNIYFVYESDLDLRRGLIILRKVRYTNEIENNLLSVPTIINMSINASNISSNNNDFSLHVQHFLGINGHDTNDLATFQQIYSLAYAIRTCIAHLPVKFGVVLDDEQLLTLPVQGEEAEERLINSLFSI